MARPATGSLKWDVKRSAWTCRVTRADGSRTPPCVLTGLAACSIAPSSPADGCACAACTIARTKAAEFSRRVREGAAVDAASKLTVNEWIESWFKDREMRGLTSVRDDRSHYRLHVADLLGMRPVAEVSRAELENLVEDLDRKARIEPGAAGAISWKTATNVWGTVSKAFADASTSKTRALRVRSDNPAEDVRGPDRGIDKAKQFLYPSEFLTFMEHPAVPLKWKRAVAIAIYIYPRDGEQRVLAWSDLDPARGVVHIHKAWDRREREIKSTKSGNTRRFAVERALLPLLAEMHAEALRAAGGDAEKVGALPIVEMPSERDMSRGLKRWLRKAGVSRRELHADTLTTKGITWHDLRATGITWCAVRGDEHLRIMQRAGHTRFETTQIYIREAENVREGFGDVFPFLPSLVTGEGVPAGFGSVSVFDTETPSSSDRAASAEDVPSAPAPVAANPKKTDKSRKAEALFELRPSAAHRGNGGSTLRGGRDSKPTLNAPETASADASEAGKEGGSSSEPVESDSPVLVLDSTPEPTDGATADPMDRLRRLLAMGDLAALAAEAATLAAEATHGDHTPPAAPAGPRKPAYRPRSARRLRGAT